MRPKQSVISLSPSVTELFASYGKVEVMRGRTAACNHPGGLEKMPVVANIKPDYEKIATLQPDLILYDTSIYNASDIEKIKALGAETFAMDVHTLKEYIDYCYRLGAYNPDPTRMSDYVEKVRSAISLCSGNPPAPGTKVAILIGNSKEGEYMIAGKGTFQADEVRTAGGEPVGPDVKNFAPLSVESLISWNPTVIVTTEGNGVNISSDPRLRSLKAVAKGRIVEFNGDVLLRAGARVDQFITRLNDVLGGMSQD